MDDIALLLDYSHLKAPLEQKRKVVVKFPEHLAQQLFEEEKR